MTTTGITDAQLLFMAKSVLCELNFSSKRLKHKKLVVTSLKLIKTSELGLSSDLFHFNWKEFFVNSISRSKWIQEKLEKFLPDWTRKVWNFTPRKSFRNALFVRETISESSRWLPACRANSGCWEVNTCRDLLWNLLCIASYQIKTQFATECRHKFN